METRTTRSLEVEVRQCDNKEQQAIELDKAIKKLKKKVEREGITKILKESYYYRKPSETKREYIKQHSKKKVQYE